MAEESLVQPRELPLLATTEACIGRVFLVTGANVGLGLEASKHLVSLGAAKVIMAVRNLEAGEKAKETIESDTGKTGVAVVWHLDLASDESVRAFAKRCATELDRLDVVISNAAVAMWGRDLVDGHSLSVRVNVLNTLLLGLLLHPQLAETARKFPDAHRQPHITFIVSSISFDTKDNWDKIKADPLVGMDTLSDADTIRTYPLTKLLQIMALLHLMPQILPSRTGVVVNMVCPGLCRTELGRNAPPQFAEMMATMYEKSARTAEVGSRTLLHGATAGLESHGHFFAHCKPADDKLPSWFTDDEAKKSQKLVWDLVSQHIESVEPGCVSKVLQ